MHKVYKLGELNRLSLVKIPKNLYNIKLTYIFLRN